ncbi:2-dehydropantoate 2-reductase [Ectothiorhodospiraceae bacterium WFHF3C12]|nr:2-dehydropantoate 2-reductase [Ectothiorhodospiraceae bacterium WFHF3C12]
MSENPSVLVLGAGAIGAFYGAILNRAGCEVSVVLRSEYEAVNENGFEISSELGDLSFRPAAVYRSAAECPTPPDYLVVGLKVVDGIDRVSAMRPAVGPDTTIVLIENGIDIEPEIAEAFPDNRLISALAYVAVSRVAPGRVVHKAYGQLVFGNFPRGVDGVTEAFGELLRSGGVKTKVTDTVVRERWRKCVWNGAFNPASVVAGGADTRTMLDVADGEAFMAALMNEIIAVAAADGHEFPAEMVQTSLEQTRKMPAYRNSMALDYLHGRPLELEAMLGNVIRLARRLNVDVPHLETVYTLARMLLAEKPPLDE